MQTFSFSVCKRLAEVLGEKCPKTYFVHVLDARRDWLHDVHPRAMEGITPTYNDLFPDKIFPAFTIADLTKEVWEELAKSLGWAGVHGDVESIQLFELWYEGGYSVADAYLMELLK